MYCMCLFFFFNDTATTEIYPLPLPDALPICRIRRHARRRTLVRASPHQPSALNASVGSILSARPRGTAHAVSPTTSMTASARSEEHTSELQSRQYLVCRLLLEKKNDIDTL